MIMNRYTSQQHAAVIELLFHKQLLNFIDAGHPFSSVQDSASARTAAERS